MAFFNPPLMNGYYHDKRSVLQDLFGTSEVRITEQTLVVKDKSYPIIQDVIILLTPEQYPATVAKIFGDQNDTASPHVHQIAADIQYSFGEEWQRYPHILAEHHKEFALYFDLVELSDLASKRVCDLGCGNGRWSYFLKDRCRELILVDFSDAIFAARRNLADSPQCLFFMADIQSLPFAQNFTDFLFSLGVLHHLPSPCLEEVRKLRRFAPELLIFLYYALDNRPVYFQWLLAVVTQIRRALAHITRPGSRRVITALGTYGLYLPLILLGKLLAPFRLSRYVPLYDFYHDKGIERIKQDVYDRFFTRIEQRVTRREIAQLRETFSEVRISQQLPYWHFLCKR